LISKKLEGKERSDSSSPGPFSPRYETGLGVYDGDSGGGLDAADETENEHSGGVKLV
jgi:hypothetical protein